MCSRTSYAPGFEGAARVARRAPSSTNFHVPYAVYGEPEGATVTQARRPAAERIARESRISIADEKIHGEPAMKRLAWSQVPKAGADCVITRCLFEDLADWFGVSNPLGPGAMQPCLYPHRSVDRSRMLLRNL